MTMVMPQTNTHRDDVDDREESTMNGDHFGNRLRALRQARGLSLRALAGRMGIPHPEIVRWEQQDRAPKQATLERIAAALQCPVSALLPAGNVSETAPDSEAVTGMLPDGNKIVTAPESLRPAGPDTALEEQLAVLTEHLDEVMRERAELRELIVEVCAAQKDCGDRPRLARAWNRLQYAAVQVELKEMGEAVESVADVLSRS
jgi:transcriptional regulator with XRE-family HTH domain